MMKGFLPVLWIVAIVLVGGFLLIAGSKLAPDSFASLVASVTGECRDVYCNDYEFICCGLKQDGQGTFKTGKVWIWEEIKTWTCNAYKCVLVQANPTIVDRHVIINGEQKYSPSLPLTLYRGDTITTGAIEIEWTYYPWTESLKWCGDSSCGSGNEGIIGIDVWGADGCTFVTDKSIYKTDGSVAVKVLEGSQLSYTVPLSQCMLATKGRHVCGNTCEACTSDNDCVAGHTLVYNGKGAECSTGQLEMYGCRKYGNEPEDYDHLPGEGTYTFGSRCEVVETKRVQCCPYAGSCGSNAVCNPDTFTCESAGTVSCSADWECGTGEFYDRETKEIFKYICKNPGTVSSYCDKQLVRQVECYWNSECPDGWFCDDDNTCKESAPHKEDCPTMCCEDDPRYWDKPCPQDQVCCPGGTQCMNTIEECESGAVAKGINWLMVLVGAIIMTIVLYAGLFVLGNVYPPLKGLARFLMHPIMFIIIIILFILLFAGLAMSVASLVM